jgi:two-component system, chemotaxis family, response regulator Rcp1
MSTDAGKPAIIEVLLVEDNLADIQLTTEGLAEGKVRPNVSIVRDGEEAMEFLKQEGRYAGAPRPQLILLDLNLPKKNGREVLAELKKDPDLKRIPVIVLSTSRAPNDIQATYGLHANCYVVKPSDLEEFGNTVRSIEEFWLSRAQLPSN